MYGFLFTTHINNLPESFDTKAYYFFLNHNLEGSGEIKHRYFYKDQYYFERQIKVKAEANKAALRAQTEEQRPKRSRMRR